MPKLHGVVAVALPLVVVASEARAQSLPGIAYTTETHAGREGHVVRIDRCKANVDFRVTPEGQRYKTVQEFATTNQALVAINASYYDTYYESNPSGATANGKANGTTISDGIPWTRTYAGLTPFAAWATDLSDFRLLRTGDGAVPANLDQAAAAFFAVKDGVACDGATPSVCSTFSSYATKRTLFGVDRTRSVIYMAVVENASPVQAARFAKEMGAHDALNYDSGGSTALFVGGSYKVAASRRVINAIVATRAAKPLAGCTAAGDAGPDATSPPGGDGGNDNVPDDPGVEPPDAPASDRDAPSVSVDEPAGEASGCSSSPSPSAPFTAMGAIGIVLVLLRFRRRVGR